MKLSQVLGFRRTYWRARGITWITNRRQCGDVGMGDTIHRIAGKWGERFEALLKKWGLDCGCPDRRRRYNRLYDYSKLYPDWCRECEGHNG